MTTIPNYPTVDNSINILRLAIELPEKCDTDTIIGSDVYNALINVKTPIKIVIKELKEAIEDCREAVVHCIGEEMTLLIETIEL